MKSCVHAEAVLHTFDLVELRKVGAVDGLIPEDAVDGEVLGRLETVLRQAVQHPGADRRRVRSQHVLLSFLQLPVAPVPAHSIQLLEFGP